MPCCNKQRLTTVLLTALLLWMTPEARAAEGHAEVIFHKSLKAASDAATPGQSLVLLVFGAEWCAPCKELKRQTLSSKEFAEQAGPLHVAEVDVDLDEKTARAFNVNAVPLLVVLTADGKIVSRASGFMHTAELILWLREGRRLARAGQWEGAAPGSQLGALATRSEAGLLTSDDFQSIISVLGERDPSERAAAARLLISQRENAVPHLIEAIADSYLGVRIAASEILQRLAPDRPAIDPWQSPVEMTNTVSLLRQWWKETASLPPAGTAAVTAADLNSIQGALEALRGDDPVRRTEAMTTLLQHQAAALPSVRDAIRRADRAGDQRAVALLEDVRWAILIPDSVESRADGVRRALARGRTGERQAAAVRLARARGEAIPALTELVNDSDALVVESAVRALSGIGGKDAIPGMSALLRAADSNLRMTAAQALGQLKNAEAIPALISVFDDPNEVVACAALAAVEEIRATTRAKDSLQAAVIDAFRGALGDARWRVRATAAEVVGKLRARELVKEVEALLGDSDGFVVKHSLATLAHLNAEPDLEQLKELSRRLPSLRADLIEVMLEEETEERIAAVTDIFNASAADEQAAILNILARHAAESDSTNDAGWKPLLTRAATASDVRLRRAAASVLSGRSPNLAAELIAPLLADEDGGVRAVAAGAVIRILEADRPGASRARYSSFPSSGRDQARTNTPAATPERLALWRASLLQRPDPRPDLRVATAVFVAGDQKSDLPMLMAAFENPENRALTQLDEAGGIGLILSRLPWPEGQVLLDRFCRHPVAYAMAVRASPRAAGSVASYLLEPARFRTSLESVSGENLTMILQMLAGYSYDSSGMWSFFSQSPQAKAIAGVMVASTNAAWRAAAVYAGGTNEPGEITAARQDASPWVRIAAVQSIARTVRDRDAIVEQLGPLLEDSDPRVARIAATALLEPELRSAAGLDYELSRFQYENFSGGRISGESFDTDRPLETLEGQPAFLPKVRAFVSATNVAENAAFALLLAQYRDWQGVDWLAEQRSSADAQKMHHWNYALLAGIALSRDPKYIPLLRQLTAGLEDEYELRQVLRAARGMTGTEARQLRLDVNRRIRASGGAVD